LNQFSKPEFVTRLAHNLRSVSYPVASPAKDVVAAVDLTFSAPGGYGGLFFNLDDPRNPKNFVLFFHDGDNGVGVLKCVNGVCSFVYGGNGKYVPGFPLVGIKNGNDYYLEYAGLRIFLGGAITIQDAGIVSNPTHGIWASSPSVRFGNGTVGGYELHPLQSARTIKFSLLGDSHVSANSFAMRAVGLYQVQRGVLASRVNWGVPGAEVNGANGENSLASQVYRARSDDADVIIMQIGHNGSTADDSFRAAYQSGVSDLKSANPRAKIYLLGNFDWFDQSGAPVVEPRLTKNKSIRAVAEQSGAVYVDTDGWVTSADTQDGLHLTDSGKIKVASLLAALL
jgi:lysophospholipase L1-like esterase